jgi:hypothetical protein
MKRRCLCRKCNREIINEAQKHGFVCKSKNNRQGAGIFCAYAARDYKGKEEKNLIWQVFFTKEEYITAKNMADEPMADELPVSLDCKWTELFGSAIPENQHRKKWEEWKQVARDAGAEDHVNFWSDTEACRGCKHLDGDWCRKVELPCTINPYLTLQRGLGPGMACMGMGHDTGIGIKQGEFDFEEGEYASGK